MRAIPRAQRRNNVEKGVGGSSENTQRGPRVKLEGNSKRRSRPWEFAEGPARKMKDVKRKWKDIKNRAVEKADTRGSRLGSRGEWERKKTC